MAKRRIRLCFACVMTLCLWAGVSLLSAQAANADHCLVIHVRLNDKALDSPQIITIRTKVSEKVLPVKAGCFPIPTDAFKDAQVDVTFELAGNRIQLSAIPTGFFNGPWDVALEDHRFGKDVILPKGARVRETCAVVFHVGDPDTLMAQTPCRRPSGSGDRPESRF